MCDDVLGTIPAWFGIPESNAAYREMAETHPTLVASVGGRPIGLLVLDRHSDASAEVHLIAVEAGHHRSGIGSRLLAEAEADLVADGVRFLQVKTLSARSTDEGYAKTRRFYLDAGFVLLEEMPDLWDPSNPAATLIKTLPSSDSIGTSSGA